MIEILFGILIAALSHGTYSYDDCKELDFKPKACSTSELLNKASKK